MKKILLVTATILVSLVVLVVALNWSVGERHLAVDIPHRYGVTDPQFDRSMGAILGPTITDGNKVTTLLNGNQIFPAMLGAIRQARHTITFETYIYWQGDIGAEFAKALIARKQDGVKVHVLLDWLGSEKIDTQYLKEMHDAGIEIRRFHKPNWYTLMRFNNRTHRKLLIIDGRIGFTGGVGIADEWQGVAQDPNHWRDTHFELEGPAVAQMQAVFGENWLKASGKQLDGPEYFPMLPAVGSLKAQMFSSSPTDGSEKMHLMYLMAISAAESEILLSNAYFVPDDLTTEAMLAARRRGVNIEIITPGAHIDSEVVAAASRQKWGPLLDAGVKIYQYDPTMFHCKEMVVDGTFVSVGSTNFDDRSFRINDEANLNIYDHDFASAQRTVFFEDRARATPLTSAQWHARPFSERVAEWFSSLLDSQL